MKNLVITVTTTTAEIMTITEAMTITEIAVTEVMADPVHLVMVLPLPAVRPLFPKAEAGVRMKRVSGLKEQLADIRKTVGVLLMENGSILMQKDTKHLAGTSQKTESGTIVLQTEHWAHRSELCIPDGLRMEQMVTGIIWIQTQERC